MSTVGASSMPLMCTLARRLSFAASAILEFEVEAGELSQAADHRPVDREHLRVADVRELLVEILDQLVGGFGTVAPVFQVDERHAGVFAIADETEAADVEDVVDRRALLHDRLDLLHHRSEE